MNNKFDSVMIQLARASQVWERSGGPWALAYFLRELGATGVVEAPDWWGTTSGVIAGNFVECHPTHNNNLFVLVNGKEIPSQFMFAAQADLWYTQVQEFLCGDNDWPEWRCPAGSFEEAVSLLTLAGRSSPERLAGIVNYI